MPVYLRWLPDSCFPHIAEAVSEAQARDGVEECHLGPPGSRSSWSFIMPFDLEHYIEDHSSTGEHKPR